MNLEQNLPQPANAEQAPAAATARGAAQALDIPEDALILVPVRKLVLFPGMVLPVTIGRELSVAAAQAAVKLAKPIGLLLQKDPTVDRPGRADLYEVGTVAQILRYITTPDGANHIVCQGEARYRVVEFLDGYPFLVARVARIAAPAEAGTELKPGDNQIVLKIRGAAGVRRSKSGSALIPAGFGVGMPEVTDDVWIDFADEAYVKWALALCRTWPAAGSRFASRRPE